MRKIVYWAIAGFLAALAYAMPAQAAAPQPCAAYDYTGTNISLCKDFDGVTADQDCSDIGYQVTLGSTTIDPWKLDKDADGKGCETKPLHAQPAPPALCSTWTARSTSAGTWGAAATGTTVSADSISLTKPGAAVTDGTEATSKVDLTGGDALTVSVALSNGAKTDAGAIRMFYYHTSNPNTMTDAPAGFAALEEGHTSITIPTSGHIGLIGFTYDGSNNSTGKVTFSGLKLGGDKLAFKCAAASPTPSPQASHTSGTSTTNLPVTGAPTGKIALIAGCVIAAGIGAIAIVRRRQTRFIAR